MALAKDNRVSIDRLSVLDKAQIDVLQRAYITTVEGLVGQLEADPEALGDLLHLDRPALKKLTVTAKDLLSPDTRKKLARRRNRRYSYGALNPHKD